MLKIISKKFALVIGEIFYFTGLPCKNGHLDNRYTKSGKCVSCVKNYHANLSEEQKNRKKKNSNTWNKNNPTYYKEWHQSNRETRLAQALTYYKNNLPRYLWRSAKQRANKQNKEFTISVDDIKIPTYCPILGIPLIINKKQHKFDSPSIDRIDNSKGYTKENIAVISYRANQLKSNGTLLELSAIVNYMESHKVDK